MSTWLKLLPLELSGINESDFIEPDHAMSKGEHQVGKMSNMSKQLFTLSKLLEKDAKQLQLDAHYCNDKAKKSELEAKSNEFVAKSSVVRELMWIGIQDELGLWNAHVGVRVDYKVVTKPPDAEDNMPPFFKRLFGG